MKNVIKKTGFCLILILSLTILSCSSSDDDCCVPPPIEPRTADDVREDFSNLTINDGVNDLELETVTAGVYWKFRIIQPEGASDSNKRPLFINLHGGASNNIPDGHKHTSCLVLPAFEDLEPYVIVPNSDGALWYEEQNQVQILALLDLAKQYLPIDEGKVVVSGFSDGGNGSFFFAQYYPTLFSAAIPMATSYNSQNSSGDYHNFAIPIYAIHGENDDLFPLSTTQGYIDGTIAAGSDLEFVVASGLDHYSGCDYVPYMDDVKDWLVNDVWSN